MGRDACRRASQAGGWRMKEIAAKKQRNGLTWSESVEVARKMVPDGQCLIKKRGLFYRPDQLGYTRCLSEAAIFDAEEARVHLCNELVSVIPLKNLREWIETELEDLQEKTKELLDLLERIDQDQPGDEG